MANLCRAYLASEFFTRKIAAIRFNSPRDNAHELSGRHRAAARAAAVTRCCDGRIIAALGAFGDVLVDVDLNRAGKERPPRVQIGLHHRFAGELLAVEFEGLVRLVFDHLQEL